MNIYYKRRIASFSGGILMIAANSIEEAQQVFDNTNDYINDEYREDAFHLLNNVTANCDTPQVLLEGGYSE